jgi:outer membrane protein assembly factor BamE (lipoprotein component of BamABCDE complex)
MTIVDSKHYKVFYIIFFSIILNNCQLKQHKKYHGINFLENREKVLIIGKTNKNDIIKLIGNPHSTSLKDNDTWIYFERTITKGRLMKLGQNVLKENNILELKFNNYGVLNYKKIYGKEDMEKVKYSKDKTKNTVTNKSFVSKFLSSIRQKMYRNQK